VLGGRVPLLLDAFGSQEAQVRAGKLKVLSLTRRVDDYPQLPVLTSQFPDYRQPAFIVLAGPAKMPANLTEQINRASAAVVQNPKFNADLARLRWRNVDGVRTPRETSELILKSRAEWGSLIREIGIEPE
jgi:tripartite-type tricarboxylate transporter receptor subunit TctC